MQQLCVFSTSSFNQLVNQVKKNYLQVQGITVELSHDVYFFE